MSTQFGGGAGDDAIGRQSDGRDGPSTCQADDLRRLIERIADQLNDSDQRQTATLAEMLARVEALGAEARHYKSKVPQEFLSAFERIENGVSLLAEQIASSHGSANEFWSDLHTNAHHEPQHGTEASSASEEPAALVDPDFEQPADVQPLAVEEPIHAFKAAMAVQPIEVGHTVDTVMANDDNAWDQHSADALAAHYELEFGAIAEDTVEGGHNNPIDGGVDMLAAVAMPQHQSSESFPHDVRASLLDSERDWLEEHFVEIARRVEESLAQRSPDIAMSNLGERFDQLEQRFGAAMHDVASRSDVEALHMLEVHISELAQQFDDTRSQLGRLDSIEHSLAAVIDRLTDPRFDSALERSASELPDLELLVSAAVEQVAQRLHSGQTAMPDLRGFAEDIADAAAERVASRIANIVPHPGEDTGADVDTIRQMLDQFINERREGDEQASAMLDTMQRALIRVLDRVDALESSYSKAAGDYGRYAAEPAGGRPVEMAAVAQGASAGPAYKQAVAFGASEHETAARPFVEPASPSSTRQIPQRQPSSPASIEQLRQDFIAEARRAKDKAASEASEAASTDIRATAPRSPVGEPAANGVKLGKPRAESVATAIEEGASIVSRLRKPSRKLLVSAIVLMIAIPGVMMLLKKSQATTPAPVGIERTNAPSDRLIAPVSPAKQTEEGASASDKPGSAGELSNGASPAAEAESIPRYGSSSPSPKLPGAEQGPTGGGTSPASKDEQPQTRPKTQSWDLNQHEQRDPRLPTGSFADGAPPAGITVAKPRRAPSLAQLERLSERNAAAQLSSQLGEAQVNAVPAALIPEFMRGEAKSETGPVGPKIQASISDSHRQPLDLPPAQVGPISLRMAAASGNPSAEFAVAARFADGTGVSQDLAEAMRWYQRSASRGFAQSQYRVATFYERGLGVKQDYARAKIWYQRAAENGNVKAMHNLAVLSAGRTAKVPDYKISAQWFKAAAEHGLADSQFNLAVLYESGLGVTQDTQAAYFWFALAARNGDTEALRRQNELEQSMKPAELDEARRKLDNWRPKQADRITNDPLAASEAWKAQAAADGAI